MAIPSDNVVTTNLGRQKYAQAQAGDIILTAITQMAFGNGGHNTTSGEATTPDPSDTTLVNQLLIKNIDSYIFSDDYTVEFKCIIDSDEMNGQVFSEIGLFDADGDLVAIKHTSPQTKTSETKFEIFFSQTF